MSAHGQETAHHAPAGDGDGGGGTGIEKDFEKVVDIMSPTGLLTELVQPMVGEEMTKLTQDVAVTTGEKMIVAGLSGGDPVEGSGGGGGEVHH